MALLWTVALAAAAGLVFAASLASKVRGSEAWQSYRRSIGQSRALPAGLAPAAAIGLAGAELGTVVLLTVPATRAAGFGLAFALSLVLSIGVGLAIARHSEAACRCFGAGDQLGPIHLTRNLLLTGLTGAGLLLAVTGPASSAGPAAVTVGLLIGLALAAVIIGWEDAVWAGSALRGARS